VLLLAGAGCRQPAMSFLAAPEPAIVWPPAPDEPRVRYVGSLTGSEDLGIRKSLGEVWDELIFGPKPPSRLVSPQAVAVDAAGNRVAVADVNGKCVHVFDLAARAYAPLVAVGTPGGSTRAPTSRPDGAGAGGDLLESPVAVCWAGDTLWAADSRLHGLAVFGPRGASRWVGLDRLKRPAGMAYCPSNQLCYVCDAGADRVLAFDAAGQVVLEFGSRGSGPGQFNCPSHIACGPDGSLVIADSFNGRLQRCGVDGAPIGQIGRKGDAAGDLALPKGVAVHPGGSIWVVDANFENVQAFTPEGQLLMALGREGHGPGEFWLPAGLCIDSQKRMWVADTHNQRVQVFAILQ
jgi:DNA-binding beta-propeller fold protein YncE